MINDISTITISTVATYLEYKEREIKIRICHEKADEQCYEIKCGCINEWLDIDDMSVLIKLLQRAVTIRKKATK